MMNNKPKQYTVLVVDDDEAQSLLVAQILAADTNLKIISTADSHDALKKAEMHEPDIIISDYYMPGMDGAELCKRIKQHPILRERMFIMLTSASAVTEKVKLLESGADELLTKPIHPDELVSRVKASLRMMSLQQDLKAQKQKLFEANELLNESYQGMLDLLATLVGVHVPDAAKRAEEAKKIVAWFAEKLSMTPEESQPIFSAAALHEIGKINMPEEILTREMKNFKEGERGHYPVAGALLISRIPKLDDVGVLIRHQLENYDGSGFPERLMQEQIPIGARILRAINYLEHINWEAMEQSLIIESIHKVHGTLLDTMISQLLEEYIMVTQNKDWLKGKRTVNVLELIPGMILASDINTGSGTKLLPKETLMTKSLVDRIHSHNQFDPIIGSIFIYQ
jgi:response regulator RpfG family c-di-GMP phosphodiesterase